MEENKNLQELLEALNKSNRQQVRWAKLQCLFSAVAALCCAGALLAIVSLIPQVTATAQQAETILNNLEQVTWQLAQANIAGVMTDLEEVARNMAEADLGSIAGDVSALVQDSQAGLNDALGKLNSLDFTTLNKAIADLAAVVEPLAKFFNRF